MGAERTTWGTSDLESLSGKYDTVTCIDVMIHYPPEKMAEMVKHLGSVADKRLIISFAPDTWYYRGLKAFGGLFPGPSKTTRAYLHPEESVVNALLSAGSSQDPRRPPVPTSTQRSLSSTRFCRLASS